MSLPRRDITQFSTALRNVGAGAALVGFARPRAAQMQATLQGVDPASPANLLDARVSARTLFARHEVGDVAFAW